jgi:hypothetical protein
LVLGSPLVALATYDDVEPLAARAGLRKPTKSGLIEKRNLSEGAVGRNHPNFFSRL